MRKSDQINEIAKALAKAQGEMKTAEKDSTNPHFRSRYCSLDAIYEACTQALSINEVSRVQDLTSNDKGVFVETILLHSSGQWLEFGPLFIPCSKFDAQAYGSAFKYCERYALCAAIGIQTGELDDDGNSAMPKNKVEETKTEIKEGLISDAQLKYLRSLITPSQETSIIEFYKIKDLSQLTMQQAKTCIDKAKGGVNG